jgi:D-alanyl-D-alanine carboxypeptidase (penicillin-binding protein 5/6)
MTVYLLLKKYPLGPYASGPSVTITAQDVQEYQRDVASQQSIAMVTQGEKLSERKILEGLLVASGNNIAHIVARWVSGSTPAFTQQMNAEAKTMGMTKTHFVGPSGLNPGNVSTPRDETVLAEKEMAIPVIRDIVAMPQISWPGGNKPIENYNYYVGHDGITGVKTGSTLYAGGCFVFSAPRTVDGQHVTVYGAVLGQQGTQKVSQLIMALNDGESLINQISSQMKVVPVVTKGEQVAQVQVPWGHSVSMVADKSLAPVMWPGARVHETLHWNGKANAGALDVTAGSRHWDIPVSLLSPVPKASLVWRLKRGL